MKSLPLAALAALLLSPAPVMAQSVGPAGVQPPPRDLPPRDTSPAGHEARGVQIEVERQMFDRMTRDISPVRLRRAEQAAALINAGDCAGARAFVLQQGDRRLADRVAEVCSADN
ncbi:hypothetical protein [Brevundimonas sp. R86498]|uniref:hypothetical protein n=1 Tax=Brevundimonas sp. R86498 TaxID=3093845 RepID=UPI0037CC2681